MWLINVFFFGPVKRTRTMTGRIDRLQRPIGLQPSRFCGVGRHERSAGERDIVLANNFSSNNLRFTENICPYIRFYERALFSPGKWWPVKQPASYECSDGFVFTYLFLFFKFGVAYDCRKWTKRRNIETRKTLTGSTNTHTHACFFYL